MKETELRLNNLVMVNYKTDLLSKVTWIQEGSINVIFDRQPDLVNGIVCSVNDLIPIQLTEEILLKCRFSMKYGTDPQEQNALKIFNLENFEILKFELDKFFFFSTGKGLIHTNIKYLHQLQNLYFALTSKELEINL